MSNEGTISSCRAALVAFGLVFLFSMFRDCSVAGASYRGCIVAIAVFIAAKLFYSIFFSALISGLSEYVSNDQAVGIEEEKLK